MDLQKKVLGYISRLRTQMMQRSFNLVFQIPDIIYMMVISY